MYVKITTGITLLLLQSYIISGMALKYIENMYKKFNEQLDIKII